MSGGCSLGAVICIRLAFLRVQHSHKEEVMTKVCNDHRQMVIQWYSTLNLMSFEYKIFTLQVGCV